MSVLGERIAAASASIDARMMEVPEWGDDKGPLKLYYHPVSGSDISRVQRKYKDFLSNPSMDAMVELIIIKAIDANDEKMFGLEDKAILNRQPAGLIATVLGSIFETISAEEQEKN